MNLQTIHNDETSEIKIDEEQHYIELFWFSHPDSAVFRQVVIIAHELAKQHKLTKWLCNLEHAEFLELDDQHWLVDKVFTDFDPQFQHDYAYLIRPLVLEVLTAYHIHDLVQMNEQTKEKISVGIFTDIDQARQWLFTTIDSK